MNYKKLKQQWICEENRSFIGWDFSYLDDNKMKVQPLTWNYINIVKKHLKSNHHLLDMKTGGGELLLTINHPHNLTSVTEAYLPNVQLCKKVLAPLGICVKQTYEDDKLPFDQNSFDIVINKHADFDLQQVDKVLKQNGYFITQQVGHTNNSDLAVKLIDGYKPQQLIQPIDYYVKQLKDMNYEIIQTEEMFPYARFYDIGAIVYFAKIIQWEFPNFSVNNSFDNLLKLQYQLENEGFIQATQHRFLIVARKL